KRPQNYSDLIKTAQSVFFWTNGRWDQLDVWQKEIFSLIGSVVVVTILHNISAFDDANEVSRHAALKYRAEMIAEYETIDKPSGSQELNPRYIYFTSKTDYIKNWKNWNHFQNYSYVSPNVGIPLSLYWFVDKDENNKKFQPSLMTSSIMRKEIIYNDVKILQEKIQHLIFILQNQQN
ncbi:8675_t:CDS:2, partial [Rhizophagus irregularis]